MADKKQIWRLALPVALLALVLGTTLGGVWHHHANAPPDTCPICHLTHQAIESTPSGIRPFIPVPTWPGPEPQRDSFAPNPAVRRIPARGPPA